MLNMSLNCETQNHSAPLGESPLAAPGKTKALAGLAHCWAPFLLEGRYETPRA